VWHLDTTESMALTDLIERLPEVEGALKGLPKRSSRPPPVGLAIATWLIAECTAQRSKTRSVDTTPGIVSQTLSNE
jgi:hypothetical protein